MEVVFLTNKRLQSSLICLRKVWWHILLPTHKIGDLPCDTLASTRLQKNRSFLLLLLTQNKFCCEQNSHSRSFRCQWYPAVPNLYTCMVKLRKCRIPPVGYYTVTFQFSDHFWKLPLRLIRSCLKRSLLDTKSRSYIRWIKIVENGRKITVKMLFCMHCQ